MKTLFTLIMLMTVTTALAVEPTCTLNGACSDKEACTKKNGILSAKNICVENKEHKILEDCKFTPDGNRAAVQKSSGSDAKDAPAPAVLPK